MNSPSPIPGKLATDAAAIVAWYKSKPLYAGGVIGLILGLVIEHFLKV